MRLMVCLPSCHNLAKVSSQYWYKGKTIVDIYFCPSASPVCSLIFTGFNVAAQLHVLQLCYFQALEGNYVFCISVWAKYFVFNNSDILRLTLTYNWTFSLTINCSAWKHQEMIFGPFAQLKLLDKLNFLTCLMCFFFLLPPNIFLSPANCWCLL